MQWQVSTDGGQTYSAVSGATSATYSFATSSSQDGYEFEAVFTNAAGIATTTPATLTIQVAPIVTANPAAATVASGGTATFTATASGNPTPTAQWEVNTGSGFTALSNGGVYSGATTGTLTITAPTATMSGYRYEAVFTNAAGTMTTTAATLTVQTTQGAPVVTTNPSAQSVTAGGTATFAAAASGDPTPTVQWEVNAGGGFTAVSNGGVYSGATAGTLTITDATAAMNGYQYEAVFSNGVSPNATSSAAALTVNTVPAVTLQPSAATVNAGGNTAFTAAASGSPTPTVEWKVSTGGGFTALSNGGVYSGATTGTLTITAATAAMNGYQYEALFSNAAGNITTTPATLTVQTTPACARRHLATFGRHSHCGRKHDVHGRRQRQPRAHGAMGGEHRQRLHRPVRRRRLQRFRDRHADDHRRRADHERLPVRSRVHQCVGKRHHHARHAHRPDHPAAPAVTAQPSAATVTAGGNTTFTAAASGSPAPTVQWEVNSGSGFAAVTNNSVYSGAATDTLTITAATTAMNGYQYEALFTNASGNITTTPAALTVQAASAAPAVTQQPSPATVTAGGNTTFTAAASGNPAPTVQWEVSSGSGFSALSNGGVYSGATTGTLTITAATAAMNGYQYEAVFSNSAGHITTSPAALTVQQTTLAAPASIVFQPQSGQGTASLTLANNSSSSLLLQFLVSGVTAGNTVNVYANGATAPIATGTVPAGATSVTVTTAGNGVLVDGSYQFVAKQSNGTTEGPGSPAAQVQIFSSLTATATSAQTAAATEGQAFSYQYTIQTNAPSGDKVTYSLASGAPAGMTLDAANSTISWTPAAGQGGTTQSFALTATDALGLSATTSLVYVSVAAADGLTVIAPPASIAIGSPVVVGVNDASAAAPTFTATTSDENGLAATFLPQTNQVLKVVTDEGEMDFQLFNNYTPNTVQHFVNLVNSGAYANTTFYRIIQSFMDQGGVNGSGTGSSIPLELNADLRFTSSGLLAMANNGVEGNNSEFFITNPNDTSNSFLDFRYTIFGKLISGDNVRAAIAATPVTTNSLTSEDSQPLTPPKIVSMSVATETTSGVLLLTALPGATGSYTVTVADGLGGSQSFKVNVGTNSYDPPNPWVQAVTVGANQSGVNTGDQIYTAADTPVTFTPQGKSADGSPVQVNVQLYRAVPQYPGYYVDNSYTAASPAADTPNPNIQLTESGSSYTLTPTDGYQGVEYLEITAITPVSGGFSLQAGSTSTGTIDFDSSDLAATAASIQSAGDRRFRRRHRLRRAVHRPGLRLQRDVCRQSSAAELRGRRHGLAGHVQEHGHRCQRRADADLHRYRDFVGRYPENLPRVSGLRAGLRRRRDRAGRAADHFHLRRRADRHREHLGQQFELRLRALLQCLRAPPATTFPSTWTAERRRSPRDRSRRAPRPSRSAPTARPRSPRAAIPSPPRSPRPTPRCFPILRRAPPLPPPATREAPSRSPARRRRPVPCPSAWRCFPRPAKWPASDRPTST